MCVNGRSSIVSSPRSDAGQHVERVTALEAERAALQRRLAAQAGEFKDELQRVRDMCCL